MMSGGLLVSIGENLSSLITNRIIIKPPEYANHEKEKYSSKDVVYNFLDFLLIKKCERSIDSYITIKNLINIFSIPFQRKMRANCVQILFSIF